MNRRTFLGAAGALLVARRGDALAHLQAAVRSQAGRSAENVAADEDFWFRVRHAFTIDRNSINLNSGSVSPGTALQALSSPCSSGSSVSDERSIQRSISARNAGSAGARLGLPGGACSAA